jgi:hypothetical protein
VVAKEKDPYPCQELNPGCPTHSLVTILTELLQFLNIHKTDSNFVARFRMHFLHVLSGSHVSILLSELYVVFGRDL